MSGPGKTSYTLRALGGVRDVTRESWDALLGAESSPFVEWTWLDALEETRCVGGETGWHPRHLSLWRDDRLVAAAPSYLKEHSEGEFVFDWSWAEFAQRLGVPYYPKLVFAVPFTPATGDRVLVRPGEDRAEITRIIASAARAWCQGAGASSVHVLFPREEEARAWESAGYLRRDGLQFRWFRHEARTFADYLAGFSSKQRNQIRRELRGVAEQGVTVETLSPEEHTVDVARVMHELYARTIDKHGVWGRMYLNESFFERIVERFRHRLAWVVAREQRSGEIVGGAFNVMRGRHLYGRYWGARAEVPFLHFAVCYYAGIAFCLEKGLDVFEPG
ncbi:MAG: GNAT family N-acetyltransferase, partial [Myxococcota bacterium]|nr:GNAT family N-acetyltransferase [Myxococcota bacterium]